MATKRLIVSKIVSGGQTGVDRGALDAAIRLGIDHGGWCPRGRRAEDGPIAARYQLRETESTAYAVRTERNVLDNDATLILCRNQPTGGTKLTCRFARRLDRPLLIVDLEREPQLDFIRSWLREHEVSVLNIAGPRESQNAGIQLATVDLVCQLFSSGEE